VWIEATASTTNSHCYLYDVTSRLVLGELFKATPIFFNHDQTKLLCEGYSLEGSWKWSLTRWLDKFSRTKPLAQKINQVEAFWVLDLKNGSAQPVGRVYQVPGTGSRFVPSPGFRYGVNRPSASVRGQELFLCDLESNLLTKITIGGKFVGWWDGHTLLVHDQGNNFVLLDVITLQTSTLLSAEATSKFMQGTGFPGGPADIGWICHWNGSGYDLYLMPAKEKNWGESFLVKLDRNDRTLKLIKRKFQFRHLGFLDATGTQYLYEGESGVPGRTPLFQPGRSP
jgi:hypothetical protein